MKISNNLPQFSGQKTLVVAAGASCAKLFLAEDGEINLLDEFSVPKHTFSDRESKFQQTGRGMTAVMGARNDHLKQDVFGRFGRELAKRITLAASGKNIHIVLFVAGEIKNMVLKNLPKQGQKLVAKIFTGNFVRQHPFELLRKLKGGDWEPGFIGQQQKFRYFAA